MKFLASAARRALRLTARSHAHVADDTSSQGALVACASATVLALVLQACSSGEQDPEAVVADRAQARMEALIAQDFDRAFDFTSPAYREALGLADYRRRYAGTSAWRRAEVESVSCGDSACDVTIRLHYELARLDGRGPAPGSMNVRTMSEQWINVGDNWYFYIK